MSKVCPLRFTADIGKNVVQVSDAQMRAAITPAEANQPITISFGGRFSDGQPRSWSAAIAELEEAVAHVYSAESDPLAVFAIGPIPLLCALGYLLGDKTAAIVYERHRHRAEAVPDEAWCWEESGPELDLVPFTPPPLQRGATDVAILLSVSGRVDVNAISAVLPQRHPQYEIRLSEPRLNAIRTRSHLASFVRQWREVLDCVRASYGSTVRVHVFPAVPVSVAVECGRRMLQVDPDLRIYNAVDRTFRYSLTVGPTGVCREPDPTQFERADILVLVAVEDEFEQLLSLLPETRSVPDTKFGGYDYTCDVAETHVVLRFVGGMGVGDGQLAADRAIERWSPRVAVWLGIAAGIHKDVSLVDVVVPDQIDGYDANQKAVDDGQGGYELRERGEVFRADHALVQAVRNFRFASQPRFEAWSRACSSDLKHELDRLESGTASGTVKESPSIKVGHIASGSVVGDAAAFVTRLHRRDSSLLALEMETVGLTRAATKRKEIVPVLALRGISDLADGRKAEVDATGHGLFRRVAMRNAARLLLAFIETGLLSRTPDNVNR